MNSGSSNDGAASDNEEEAKRSVRSAEELASAASMAQYSQGGSALNRSFESTQSKRGRPAQPELWSRVISAQHWDPEQVKVFQVNTDLLLEDALPKIPQKKRNENRWEPLF